MRVRVPFFAILGLLLILPAALAPERGGAAPTAAGDDRFGIVFVNAPGYPNAETRYARAQATGARWTRWPFYWQDIETSNGQFNFGPQDVVVNADVAHGFQNNAILLGVPGWMSSPQRPAATPFPRVGPQPGLSGADALRRPAPAPAAPTVVPGGGVLNLYAPVFRADGGINPDNYWARFVYTTVNRYKDRVKVWEMWNEPDLKDANGNGVFWQGSTGDYYQLLKVAYLAAKKADPNAVVVFAGLAYFSDPGFFGRVLDLMAADPSAPGQGYYFDALPWHFYSSSYNVYDIPKQSMDLMRARGLAKPVWINETNLPVCSDPADPTFTCPQTYRGTPEEQANFVIQAYAEAIAVDLQKLFLFQLYDDGVGHDEFYGLLRNDNTARPAYAAYATAATYLSNARAAARYTEAGGAVERVVVIGTPLGRTTVIWNRTPTPLTALVSAANLSGTLVNKAGAATPISAGADGNYRISLPGATNRDPSGNYNIGGDPFILVEALPSLKPAFFLPIAGH
jgi:hypothetical protein